MLKPGTQRNREIRGAHFQFELVPHEPEVGLPQPGGRTRWEIVEALDESGDELSPEDERYAEALAWVDSMNSTDD